MKYILMSNSLSGYMCLFYNIKILRETTKTAHKAQHASFVLFYHLLFVLFLTNTQILQPLLITKDACIL
jgi:hypothetical protein